jgi:hypothetical protein
MNIAVGGFRFLTVCVALIWIVCGALTVLVISEDPIELPFSLSRWRMMLTSIGLAAIIGAQLSINLMRRDLEIPGGVAFALALWGLVATVVGYGWALALAMAYRGGWQPPLESILTSPVGSILAALAMMAIIWVIPLLVIVLLIWIWEGFTR